jgi:hypothetical protein
LFCGGPLDGSSFVAHRMNNQCSIDGKENGVLVENVISLSSADAEEWVDLDELSVMNSVGPNEKDVETSDVDSAVDAEPYK